MSAGETAIGIDAGGTRVRAARVDGSGRILQRVVEPVVRDRDGFVAQLLALAGAVGDGTSVALGVGFPGRVDAARGVVLSAGYLDAAGLPLAETLANLTGLPSRIENDATMALLAEASVRTGGSSGLLAMMTVGTGIGGAILLDGVPWYGGGVSGQFGHLVVAADGPPCNCGRTGCVETFSAGPGLQRLAVAAGLPPDLPAQEFLARADVGDAAAAAVLERWAEPFSRAIETLAAAIDPRLVIVGGGLGATMVGALQRLPARGGWFGVAVEGAVLGDDAGVVGAALASLYAVPR